MREKFSFVRSFGQVAGLLFAIVGVSSTPYGFAADDGRAPSLVLIVMDPLSAPLACDCVQGYAQRKYEKLGLFLAKRLKREVKIVWAESLHAAFKETDHRADIVIGKHSVALANAVELKLDLQPIASLTDKDGSLWQKGLFVVRKDDSAQVVSDLSGYRIMFGPSDCDEKYAAPIASLRSTNIEIPEKPEIFSACSVAATKLLELPADEKAAAVISSYAAPLLEGCGTIKKGDIRVIGETQPVRFITAFVNKQLDEPTRNEIIAGLQAVGEDADLLTALETESGFIEFSEPATNKDSKGPATDRAALSDGQKKN